GQVVGAVLGLLAPDHYPVPLGVLDAVVALGVGPRGGHVELTDAVSAGRDPQLGITSEISDENDLVDATSHGSASSRRIRLRSVARAFQRFRRVPDTSATRHAALHGNRCAPSPRAYRNTEPTRRCPRGGREATPACG